MSQRIRGQEATIQIVVDGNVKKGTFTKVTSFNLTPRTEISETPFLGEIQDDLDIQHHGYDFDFEVHQEDRTAYDLLQTIVDREANRTAHPNVNIVVTMAYRSLEDPAVTFVMEQCVMKMDSMGFGGRKEYVAAKFSGKCKVVTTI